MKFEKRIIIVMKKYRNALIYWLLIFSFCLFPVSSFAENTIAIDEKNFPDEIFRKYVESFDTNGDHKLDESELEKAETISCPDAAITSLEGIQHFSFLKSLDCSGNRLTSLDLRENYWLEKIDCTGNELTVLLLSEGPFLRSVECQENNLRYLSVDNSYWIMRPLVAETEREETADGYALYSKVMEDGSTASLVLDPKVTVTSEYQKKLSAQESVSVEDGKMSYWIHYTVNDDGTVTYENYDGKYKYPDRKSYTIPDEIEGMTVTAIGDKAFSDCSGLTEIKIPKTVTKIGEHAFAYCNKLAKINLPEKLESIGDEAFIACSSLKNITIPDSVTETSGNPFTGLESGKIKIGKKHPVFEIRGDALINKQTQTMVSYLGKKKATVYTVPDGVVSIGRKAFSCSGLQSVTLPETVVEIGELCFEQCLDLESVSLPESLERIGDRAFEYCTKMKSIYLPGNLKEIGSNPFTCAGTRNIDISPSNTAYSFKNDALFSVEDGRLISFLGDYDFWNPEEDRKKTITYTVPEGTRIIGENAFYRISKVSWIVLPESVEEIGAGAFSGMEKLNMINIPASVREIGKSAFSGAALITVNMEAQIKTLPEEAFSSCSHLTGVKLPESLETIENAAFFYCDSLCDIVIPDSVTDIGASAFRHCVSLRSIHLPANLKKLSESLLLECSALTRLEIPLSVEEIDEFAISKCNGLKELVLPASVLRIREYAICRNESLERVVMNEGIESIGSYAFGQNTSLTEAVIPEGVHFINFSSFMNCEHLGNSFTEFLESLKQYGIEF